MKYKYTQLNKEQKPPNYGFSPYKGESFLRAYKNNRYKQIEILKKQIYTDFDIIKYIESILKNTSNITLIQLIKTIKSFYKLESIDRENLQTVFFYQRKFEVSKMIYDSYIGNKAALKSSHIEPLNYLMFGYLIVISIDKSRDDRIKLNLYSTLLKINDYCIGLNSTNYNIILEANLISELRLYQVILNGDL